MLFLRRFVAASNPPNIASPIPANPVLVSVAPVLAKRFGWAFSSAFSTTFVTFLKIWRTFPFSSITVLTNSYPEILPASTVPFSVGFNGFPFSSVQIVVLFIVGIREDFLKICCTFPFSSTTVVTNSYPGIDPESLVPFSVGFNGFPSSSTHVVDFSTTGVVTFSYTCSISPFGSFLVSTNLYPGISFFGCSPSSVG